MRTVRAVTADDLFVHPRRDDAVDVDGLRDVLEAARARALQHELRLDPLGRGGAHHDLAGLRGAGKAGGQVGGGTRGRERPALAAAAADLGGADQRVAGIDAHVQADGREDAAVLLVELLGTLPDGEGGAGGVQRVVGGGGLRLEDDHEPVAGRLVDVAMVALDELEEAREVRLHELVQLARVQLLGQLRVAGDVEEQHRDLDVLLLQLGGVGVLLEEALDRLRHELGQLALELLEQLQPLA
jgi:hypothetical protein